VIFVLSSRSEAVLFLTVIQQDCRNYRSKKLRPRHTSLFFAVGIWTVCQLTHSKRRALVVEAKDGGDAIDEAAAGPEGLRRTMMASWGWRRRLLVWWWPFELSKAEDREGDDGDEEDQTAGEDGTTTATEIYCLRTVTVRMKWMKTLFGESGRHTVFGISDADDGTDTRRLLHEPNAALFLWQRQLAVHRCWCCCRW
jgi:hypothetical protein